MPFFLLTVRTSQKEGQKASLMKYVSVALVCYVGVLVLLLLWGRGDAFTLSILGENGLSINLYTILFIAFFGIGYGAYYATADMPIPMVADCSDYETYRSGKYIPGIMGTLFSLVDKLVSSLSATVVGIAVSFVGLQSLPTQYDPYTPGMNWVVIVLFCIIPMVAWAATLIAMKGYTLTGAKMKEIQAVNACRRDAVAKGMKLEEAMFGMGLTLKPEDFKVVFSRPKDVVIGCIAQFTLMPFLAWALTQVFHLPTELAIGVILVGTCPGGTSSNVMTYLSKGDVALSVGMTAVSTVLAPFLTPLLTLLYAGQRVDVNPMNMFLSIVKVVLVPIALGFVVNHFFHAFTQNAVRVLPLVSTTAIVLIICAVVSANSAKIMTSGLLILAVVILHNLLGYLTGFGVGKLLKLDSTKCRAISIEVGMQNSGLATSLAAAHFAQYPLATIPGAVFSVWHNISGAILANFFARTAEKKD